MILLFAEITAFAEIVMVEVEVWIKIELMRVAGIILPAASATLPVPHFVLLEVAANSAANACGLMTVYVSNVFEIVSFIYGFAAFGAVVPMVHRPQNVVFTVGINVLVRLFCLFGIAITADKRGSYDDDRKKKRCNSFCHTLTSFPLGPMCLTVTVTA